MKIIDLLNKIANGEEVPKFKFKGHNAIWEYKYEFEQFQWETINLDVLHCLNDEIEIIKEEKEIEKIEVDKNGYIHTELGAWKGRIMDEAFATKINELIDEINKLKKEGK